MTDNEITKALECCKNNNSADCPLLNYSETSADCMQELINCAFDLINRQKAEIISLKSKQYKVSGEAIFKAKCEAIKEFVERLKDSLIKGGIYPAFVKNTIERVANEIVGDNNG